MSTQRLKVVPLGIGTVLHLNQDVRSVVSCVRHEQLPTVHPTPGSSVLEPYLSGRRKPFVLRPRFTGIHKGFVVFQCGLQHATKH